MIFLEGISKSFHKKYVLDDISFCIEDNGITTIVGPNGIGKTTLLNLLCGVLYPDKGSIQFSVGSPKDMFTIQSGSQNLYAKNTVEENITFLSILRGLSMSEIKANIEKYLPFFPIYDSIRQKLFEELSTGQKQLVTIMAALVANAQYILLDEPTEGLDLNHKSQLYRILSNICKSKTIIMTSHDAEFVSSLSHHFIFLYDGKIAALREQLTKNAFLEQYKSLYKTETNYENNIL